MKTYEEQMLEGFLVAAKNVSAYIDSEVIQYYLNKNKKKEKDMSKYRDFKVTVVLNGFLIKIGCSEVVASSPEELVLLVKKYMKDPAKMERQMLKDSFRTCDTGYGLNEGGGGGGGNTGTTTGGFGYATPTHKSYTIPYNTPHAGATGGTVSAGGVGWTTAVGWNGGGKSGNEVGGRV